MLLKNFVDGDGFLWARRRGVVDTLKPAPHNLFAVRDLNSVRLSDGSLNTDLEEWYANTLESEGAVFFDDLLNAVRNGKTIGLSPDTWYFWHVFLYHHIKRQPASIERASTNTDIENFLSRLIDNELANGTAQLGDEVREDFQTRMLQAAKVRARSLQPSENMQKLFKTLGMAVFRVNDPRKSLIIGDCAVATAIIGGAQTFFAPVASDVALGFYSEPGEVQIIDLDAATIRRMNEAMAADSMTIAGRSGRLVLSLLPL